MDETHLNSWTDDGNVFRIFQWIHFKHTYGHFDGWWCKRNLACILVLCERFFQHTSHLVEFFSSHQDHYLSRDFRSTIIYHGDKVLITTDELFII